MLRSSQSVNQCPYKTRIIVSFGCHRISLYFKPRYENSGVLYITGKVCRYIEHIRKYADKIKTNPFWNVYNKAYKQHYARYLKKKMTQAEFAEWADYALELRSKAENGEIEFEEYKVRIRK